MVDWQLAEKVAQGVAAMAPAGDPRPFQALDAAAAESLALVGEYKGLDPVAAVPPLEAIDRSGWIEANLRSLRGVLEPATERAGSRLGPLAGPVGAAAGAVLAVEAGAISGFLAGRVLGQYEFPVLEPDAPARLLMVAPNLGNAAQTLDADPVELGRWVALHEMTHALQFGGVPWLRPFLADAVRELTSALDVDTGTLLGGVGGLADVRGLVDRVREGGIAALVLSPERRELMASLQCFMAVLEGYAEHVMDAVGGDVLADLPALRAAMQRRRGDRSGFLRLLERLIGMDMKMRQYEDGKRFCDEVVRMGGMDALNAVWDGPAAMPSADELGDPARWLARTATAA
jgi:coenzyme F420 biosynthesis associated uncharacterized protein